MTYKDSPELEFDLLACSHVNRVNRIQGKQKQIMGNA